MASNTVEFIIQLRDKFSKNIGKASTAMDKFDGKAKKTSSSIGGLGKKLAGLVSIAAVGALFIKTARDVAAYETAIASLSAITGATGDTLEGFKNKVNEVAKNTKSSSIAVAKAFEVIGSAKPELLASADALGKVTESAIILSEASGLDLEASALALTGAMNQFSIGADGAATSIDILANGAKLGAAAIPLISQSIEKFGSVASGFNVNLGESVALVEALADKSLKGAEAGTALRAMLSKMETIKESPALKRLAAAGVDISKVADATLPLQERMEALAPIANDAGLKIKFFGETGKQAADIILANTDRLGELTKGMSESGTAAIQQAAQNNTLNKRLEQLSNTWTNLFTSSSQVDGIMSKLKDTIAFVTDNLETIVSVIGTAIGIFLVVKAGIEAVSIATDLWTAAQWLLDAALNANPVGLVIIAIVALVAITAIIIAKWDEWGSIVVFILGPLGIIITIIKVLIDNLGRIKEVLILVSGVFLALFRIIKNQVVAEFHRLLGILTPVVAAIMKVGRIVAEFLFGPFESGKDIIKSTIDFMIEKIKQFLGVLAKIPGVSEAIGDVRNLVDVGGGGKKGLSNEAKQRRKDKSKGIFDNIPATDGTLSKLPTIGAAPDSLGGAGTTIKSAAPKTFNLTIGSLIQELEIHSANLNEGAEEMADKMKQALLGGLNDVQTDLQ